MLNLTLPLQLDPKADLETLFPFWQRPTLSHHSQELNHPVEHRWQFYERRRRHRAMARHTLELVMRILHSIAIALLAFGMGQLYIDHIRVHDASQTRNIYSKRNIAAIVAIFCGAISWFTVLGMDIAKALLTEGLTFTLEALHYPLVAVLLSLVLQTAYTIFAKHTHREGPSKNHSKPHNMLTIGCDDSTT